MKYLVISDIHDNKPNLEKVLSYAKENNLTEGICLGDFVSPPIVKVMIASGINWKACWGNNEGEKVIISRLTAEATNFELGSTTDTEFELDGKKVFISHYPRVAEVAAKSGEFDAVFYGHDHEKFTGKEGKTLLANPGEVWGHATGNPTFGVWDTDSNEFEIKEIS
jgi:hypothetical protein